MSYREEFSDAFELAWKGITGNSTSWTSLERMAAREAFELGAKWQAARAGGDGEAVKIGELLLPEFSCGDMPDPDIDFDIGAAQRLQESLVREIDGTMRLPIYVGRPPAPAAKPMSDDIEQSFQAWVRRNCPPGNHMNLFRGAHSAGYWDGQESVAPDYEQGPAAKVPEGFALVPDISDADEIVSRLYRRFKDWSARGFTADDVTWCEVRADILGLIATATPQPPVQAVPDVDALAQFIRKVNGNNDMGAGAMAEKICDWLSAAPAPEGGE